MSDHQRREFRGVWIPAAIWLNKNLSVQEKVMLVEIDSLQHPERGCFKSNKSLGEFFNISPSRASEIISSLAERGFIRVNLVYQGKQVVERQIFMANRTPDPIRKTEGGYSENGERGIRKTEGGYSENGEESNTPKSNTEEGSTAPAEPPEPPPSANDENQEGQKPKRKSAPPVTLKTYLENLKASGEPKVIRDDDPVFDYARDTGIPIDFIKICWFEFRDRYVNGDRRSKRYRDWRATFRNSVRDNWYGIWYLNNATGGYELTTKGHQAKRNMEAKLVA